MNCIKDLSDLKLQFSKLRMSADQWEAQAKRLHAQVGDLQAENAELRIRADQGDRQIEELRAQIASAQGEERPSNPPPDESM